MAFGRHAGRVLECDAKGVDALITAHFGKRFYFAAGFRQQLFSVFDSDALKLLSGGVANVLQKRLVHSAP
jgi:hypothetical protein